MKGLVFEAPQIVEVVGPLIFLAGPIQGTPPWQDEAVTIIHNLNAEIHIASPRRHGVSTGEFSVDAYNEQVDWETRYLNQAAQNGVVLFWLAKETVHLPQRAYAQTSRFELAEWKEKHRQCGSALVLGIENGFTGNRYIRRRFTQDCPDIPIADSLKATCEAAVNLAIKTNIH